MSNTKTNIIFNFAGKIIPALLGIAITPFYLHYLSVEYYGIIGFFASIQSFLMLLDGGISPTLNREVARLSAFPEKKTEIRNLARTLEIFCWVCAVLACLLAIAVSPFAAKYWLNSQNISSEILIEAFILMSITLVFQWTISFYNGGLIGLQKQKISNLITIIFAFPRLIGSLLILVYVSSTIKALLLWQMLLIALNCFTLLIFFWKSLPKDTNRPKFDKVLLKGIWRYAVGMFGTSIVVLILTQTDKLILSKMLPLESFGYYSLAQMLAGMGIGMIVSSIITPYFPQFSQLAAHEKTEELKQIYHRASQVMSFFVIPTVCIMAFFSYQILLIWTRKTDVAENTYLLLILVAIGSGLNGFMHVPYYMQLAHGITKIGFWQNVIAIIVLIPLMIYATSYYGAIGGAFAWVLLNLGYVVLSMPIMHRLILQGELKKWYLQDIGMPLLVTIVLSGILYYFSNQFLNQYNSAYIIVLIIALNAIILFPVCAFTIPVIREFGLRKFSKI